MFFLQDSRTFLSILADLRNAFLWMISTCPLISKSSRPLTSPLWIVPSTLITIGITISFILHSFFNSLARSRYSFLLLPFDFILWSVGMAKSFIRTVFFSIFFFFFNITWSGRLAEIWSSVCISKFQRSLCVSFFRKYSEFYLYHLFVWSNFICLYNSQWTTFPTQSCLALYSFCTNLLHSLIVWLTFRLYYHLTLLLLLFSLLLSFFFTILYWVFT